MSTVSRAIPAALAVAAALSTALAVTPPAAGATTGFLDRAMSSSDPGVPATFNDPGCTPSAGENPVLYVHGTSDASAYFENTATRLREAGRCVWAFDYGRMDASLQHLIPGMYGIGDLTVSAEALADNVEHVRAVTGADQLDLIGYSQGGTLIKMYIQQLGGAPYVDRVITLGATFAGTTGGGKLELAEELIRHYPAEMAALAGTAVIQQATGSEIIEQLAVLPDTSPGITYTAFYTPLDDIATPIQTSMLEAVPGADVANVDVTEACHGAPLTHGDLHTHPVMADMILWGLNRTPGDHVVPTDLCQV